MAHNETLRPDGTRSTLSGNEDFALWLLQRLKPSQVVYAAHSDDPGYLAMCEASSSLGLSTRCLAIEPNEDARLSLADGSVDLLVLADEEGDDRVQSALDTWAPKLSEGGVVALTTAASNAEGSPLWRRLSDLYPSFVVDARHRLLVLGKKIPDELSAIFELESFAASMDAVDSEIPAPTSLAEGDWQALVQQLQARAAELERARNALAESEERLKEATQRGAASERDLHMLSRALENARQSSKMTVQSLHYFQNEVAMLKGSRSWAVTAPLRGALNVARRCSGLLRQVRFLSGVLGRRVASEGLGAALKKALAIASKPRSMLQLLLDNAGAELSPQYMLPPAHPANKALKQRVLLIAELSLPQCLKYRVMQKRQMIESLGIECTVVKWSDVASARSLLQTHTVAIFYRVPGYPEILETIQMARQLGVQTYWEVDDLIFDLEHYGNNSNLLDLDRKTRSSILKGVPLYRAAMLACDGAIASTMPLADVMRRTGVKNVHVIENGLDVETSHIAASIDAMPRRSDGLVRIVYGSGSKAHDSDFRVASAAIQKVLAARYHVRLTVIGSLTLPPEFEALSSQIERLPPSDYETYLKRLSRCHINIAPLEDTIFNDAKSNIKYLEAATLRIPSVCSPSAEYRTTIQHGQTGFLASTPEEWEAVLFQLVDDALLRQEVGNRAHDHVHAHYTPENIAVEQVQPILALARQFSPKPLRILGVNIFFEPRSFGGATIVAEEVARRINAGDSAEYAMVTSLPTSDVHAYKVVRYTSSAAEVFALGLPHESDPSLSFDNPYPVESFREVLRAWQPDVVHIHSIQGIGVQVAEACQAEGIPFAVTLHDAWWICARQFMVTGEGKYCYQRKVDINICSTCVPSPTLNPYRQFRLHEVLSSAALLMSPSAFFRGIYIDNGFAAERVVVNKNGIVRPKRAPVRTPPSKRPLRFGFVGGEGPIKGSSLIKKAFRNLPQHTNYELRVVDNELNLGRRSIFEKNWEIPGKLEVVPAYTQETIDEFYEGIDVLLFPTQWKESFGLSVREALIRDCWVIATDAGGVIEDIVAGENGDVIPLEDDGTELQRAIEQLLTDPSRLDGYRNLHAGMISLFDEQAQELVDYLTVVAKEHKRSDSGASTLKTG